MNVTDISGKWVYLEAYLKLQKEYEEQKKEIDRLKRYEWLHKRKYNNYEN